VTWGSAKWYAFPRTPFPVTFVPRNDVAALEAAVDASTAAVIVEPVQGVAGAFDLAPEFLEAARRRCDAAGASLVFDEVQCGAGRSGRGFAAELYGVTPDLLTSAKSLGAGFPVGAVVMSEKVASRLAVGDLGTTFGGGPMACALVATVIEAIEAESLLDNVRRLESRLRSSCVAGPVEAIQGKGFLLGLRCAGPAAAVRDALLERDILVGTSADPNVLRLMPPYVLAEEHVDRLAAALEEIGA
jgi:acetylornithine/succinyldiaminopimelate/putrescine aminotransferase